jgi:phosphoglycolate phosphatase
MENNLRMVVLDCDGTIVDSQKAIVAMMHATFNAHDLELPDRIEILRGVGLELSVGIERLLPVDHDQELSELYETYKKLATAYREEGGREDPLYPDASPVIRALDKANWLLGVATGKARVGLDHVLDHHSLNDLFVTKQTSDSAAGKPNPEMLYNAMRDTGVDAEFVFMVGDTTYDMSMAVNAGTRAIGVSWGYHEAEELLEAGAEVVVHSYNELYAVLEGTIQN